MDDLIVLGTIKPGDTICVSTLSVAVHRSWLSGMWRSLLRESRDKTKAWVELVVDFAVAWMVNHERVNGSEYLQTHLNFLDTVWKAQEGIQNLAQTYEGDDETTRFFAQSCELLSGYALGMQTDIAAIDDLSADGPSTIARSNPIEINQKLSDFVHVDIENRSVPHASKSPSSVSPANSGARMARWMSSTFSATSSYPHF